MGVVLARMGKAVRKFACMGLQGEYTFGPEDHGPKAGSSADERMSSDDEVESGNGACNPNPKDDI